MVPPPDHGANVLGCGPHTACCSGCSPCLRCGKGSAKDFAQVEIADSQDAGDRGFGASALCR